MHRFTLLMGGVEVSDNDVIRKLYILHEDGIAEEEAYATIGSGAAYAEYLLSKFYDPGMKLDVGKKLAAYVVREVERMDPNVGGPINMVAIGVRKSGEALELEYQELESRDIDLLGLELTELEKLMNRVFKNVLLGELRKEDLERMLNLR